MSHANEPCRGRRRDARAAPRGCTPRRAGTLVAAAAAVAVMATARAPGAAPAIVWNVSASVPTGLYRVRPLPPPVAAMVAVGMLVVVRPPEPLAAFLAEGHYLPRGVPLIKPVLAIAGQTVCRARAVVTVDGREAGVARTRDGRGHPLPAWEGCRTIAGDEVFVMNAAEPSSLDGRYFGPLSLSAIAGRAEPLLTFTASVAAD